MSAVDWPTDPAWFLPPALDDFNDRRELELLVCRAACWQRRGLDRAISIVAPRDFRHGTWRTVWEAIIRLAEDRRDVTVADLADDLSQRSQLGAIGGLSTILRLCDDAYPGHCPATFGTLLAEWARRDRLSQTLSAAEIVDGTVDIDQLSAKLAEDANPEFNPGIDRVSDVRDAVIDRIAGVGDVEGVRCGLGTLDELYRVERGEFTVVTGIPGSGKSSVVDQVAVNLAEKHDWRFAIFSPESAPTDQHVVKLATMYARASLSRCTSKQVEASLGWIEDHFEWVNSTEGVTVEEILRRADVIHRRRPIHGLIVDPWNEIDREGNRDTETLRISEGLTRLRRWSRKRDVHLWLIAHPKKLQKRPSGDYEKPTLYDIANSATFRDKADMGLIIHRDQSPGAMSPTEINVVKVRFRRNGRIGQALLAMDVETERFRPGGQL